MIVKGKKNLGRLDLLKIIMKFKNKLYEETEVDVFMIKFYLNQKEDNKNNFLSLVRSFYKNSTGRLSDILFQANLR